LHFDFQTCVEIPKDRLILYRETCFFNQKIKRIMQEEQQQLNETTDTSTKQPAETTTKKTPPRNPNDPENHLDPAEPRWFAARTRFRDEKMAFKMLELAGIEAYLPIKKMSRRYGRKLRHVDMPLINSFVFVKITQPQHAMVLKTQYVTGFLKFGKNMLAIPEKQILMLRRLLGEDVEIEIEVVETVMEKGDAVEITTGAFLGLQGTLVNIKGKDKMVIDLTNSGYSILIEVDKSILQKV
jgi:transcription antitermination factor NusG